MSCANLIVAGSLLTGPAYVNSASGEPDTAPPAAEVPTGLVAVAFSAAGSENAPLTRCPGAVELASATDSAASPAEETTVAVVCPVYVFATPGANAPNVAGVPSVSAS